MGKSEISDDLGESLERFVSELVESGRYSSRNEVLRFGVLMVQERELFELWPIKKKPRPTEGS